MSRAPVYPPDLARFVAAHWPEATPLRVPVPLLEEALSASFLASLTTEEGRPTRFRLLLTPAGDLPEHGAPGEGVLRLLFDRTRALHADELRRLSPAVHFETSLIGAHEEQGKLRIWGVAHSGPAWLAPSWGGRNRVPVWTTDPIIHASGPGQLAVRTAGKLVGAIERGAIVDAMMDVFDSEWLPAMFAREREEVLAQHDAGQVGAAVPTSVELSLIRKIGQHMLRRAIQVIRGARHGGMLLFVDAGCEPPAWGLRMKYGLTRDDATHRYRVLLLRILDALAAATSKATVGWGDFLSDGNPDLERLEQSVFEISRAIANFAAIDGAVVLDKRLGLVGFGAEVSAELPAPSRVYRALDVEGRERAFDDIENVGTRHRAAYRFVNDNPGGVAIVVSHDGGVTFVAKRDGDVVFWRQSVSP